MTFDPSPNDTGRSTLEIRTSLDNVLENDETFNATLSVPPQYTGQVVEGIPSVATVTINDATSMLKRTKPLYQYIACIYAQNVFIETRESFFSTIYIFMYVKNEQPYIPFLHSP